MEHVSHFNQKMAVYANDEALMCKVFPSNLAMHWFDALEEGLMGSFEELTRAFKARFITCSRVPKPVDSLLFMAMREGETLKTYSDRYWETYNEIDGNFENMVVRTFKVGLPVEHELRKSLTMKSALNMRQLMDHIDKYKRVEEDLIQGKGKVKMVLERRDPRRGGYQGNHPRGEFPNQAPSTGAQLVNSLFKEAVYHIQEKIKNELYFKWPNKMGGDPSRRNQSLYCHYHQDRGHTTKDCKSLRDHLSQLARAGKLNRFLHQPTRQFGHLGAEFHKGSSLLPIRGAINVILTKPGNNGTSSTRVMSVGVGCDMEANDQAPKRARVMVTPTLGFFEEDKQGTLQPHGDALVVTIRIGGYDVKRVLVD
ncbi:uncharacterized protein LOC112002184 [Quercus suber]|uniref:uncharacterized protein LOC112002184 n=1 Tax=Quercus suber TaxID=58331 RepID=UPI000CE28A28|nr:uncharacterized protein LOC112002184 [Quercus suber]